MSTSRERTMGGLYPQGYFRQYNGTGGLVSSQTRARATNLDAVCKDVVGNFPRQNPFDLRRTTREGSVANLEWRVSSTLIQRWEENTTSFASADYITPLPGFTPPTISRILAQSGPLTPTVNLPLFVFELKDVPRMLKDAGDFLHKIKKPPPPGRGTLSEIASATLAYQFGWKPLAEDILKLISFQEAVAKVQRRLDRAESQRGYRHRVNLGEQTASQTLNQTLWSEGGFSSGLVPIRCTASRKTWVTVKWKLKEKQVFGKHSSRYTNAMRVMLGLNPGMIPISVWKALPWTWLIDWFTDISNVLITSYNQIYYTAMDAMIMQTTTYKASHGGLRWNTPPRTGQISSGQYERVIKTRAPFPLTAPNLPTLRRPALDAFQLSVLGSLTILRIKSGGRKATRG